MCLGHRPKCAGFARVICQHEQMQKGSQNNDGFRCGTGTSLRKPAACNYIIQPTHQPANPPTHQPTHRPSNHRNYPTIKTSQPPHPTIQPSNHGQPRPTNARTHARKQASNQPPDPTNPTNPTQSTKPTRYCSEWLPGAGKKASGVTESAKDCQKVTYTGGEAPLVRQRSQAAKADFARKACHMLEQLVQTGSQNCRGNDSYLGQRHTNTVLVRTVQSGGGTPQSIVMHRRETTTTCQD